MFGLESEKSGTLVPNSEKFEKFEKLNLPGHCYGSSKNGPYGPQGPWTMGPMGPRGLGPYVNIMDVLCIIKTLY